MNTVKLNESQKAAIFALIGVGILLIFIGTGIEEKKESTKLSESMFIDLCKASRGQLIYGEGIGKFIICQCGGKDVHYSDVRYQENVGDLCA